MSSTIFLECLARSGQALRMGLDQSSKKKAVQAGIRMLPSEKSELEAAAKADDRNLSAWARPILLREAKEQARLGGRRVLPTPEESTGRWWLSLPADVRMLLYRLGEGLRDRRAGAVPLDQIPLPQLPDTALGSGQEADRSGKGLGRTKRRKA
jgi:hypothetical protein